jgi:ER membrane protein complex subunit 10
MTLRSPLLKEPPPLTPQGEVVKPEPEKTFLQKYWIYIAGVLLALRKPHLFVRFVLVN